MTDSEFKQLIKDFAFDSIRANQAWSKNVEHEIGHYLDAARYSYVELVQEDSFSPCDGCPNLALFYADNTIAEQYCEKHTCPIWIESHPDDRTKQINTFTDKRWKILEKEKPANPCAGCKFRKYHDWAEPTWMGFFQHHYDCENPSCPMWERLWWRIKDDGTVLLDQEPIKAKRKIQHAAYTFVRWANKLIGDVFKWWR